MRTAEPQPPARVHVRELCLVFVVASAAACASTGSTGPDAHATSAPQTAAQEVPTAQPPPAQAASTQPPADAQAPQGEPQPVADPQATATADASGLAVHGSLTSRYRLRSTDDASDQDLYETLVLDVGDDRKDPVTAHIVGRTAADLDGLHDSPPGSTFFSLSDTSNESIDSLLYEAYIDIEKPPGLGELRIGRQLDYLTPEFAYFDGVRLATKETKTTQTSGGVYGGVPVRLYESTSNSDAIVGAWGESQPWKSGRVRADWMHVEDERFGDGTNDLFGLALWQRVGERARVDGAYTRLEERDRDVRLRGTWDDPQHDLTAQVSYYNLLETQKQLAAEFDPFFSALHELYPFAQYRAQLSKGLGEHTRVEGGADIRRVDDSNDEGAYNRDFERGWLSLVLLDRIWQGFVMTLTGDWWNSDGNDIETWGFDLSQTLSDGFTIGGGSTYALYKYDLMLGEERDDIRIWYVTLRKAVGQAWLFDLRYDLEDDDNDRFHSVLVGATWRF